MAVLELDSRIQGGLERSVSLLLLAVALVSVLILSAWWIPAITSHLPDAWHLMKANTAVGMLLAAGGLGARVVNARFALRHIQTVLGVCLLLLAVLTLFEYLGYSALGMDTWLAADNASPLPGRMSPQTAIGFLILALAVLTLECHVGVVALAADCLAIAIAAFVLMLSAGYAFGALRVYGESEAIRVSPETLLCFLLLGLVVCIRRSGSGPLRIMRGQGIGSRIARLAVPGAILLPFVLATVRGLVVVRGVLDPNTAGALTLTVLSLASAGLVLFLARRINQLEAQVLGHSLRRSREALQISEHRYKELVDQALEGVMVREHGGRILYANEALCSMLRYSPAELTSMSMRDLVHPDDREAILDVQRLEPGGSLRLQKRMCRKDGQVLDVQVSARRLANGDVQSTMQDLTEHRRAEERFRAMVQGSPNAMLMVDEAGVILLANPLAERIFGYGPEELLGKQVEALIPMRLRAQHPSMRAGLHRNLQVRSMGAGRELFGLRKDGSEVPVEIGLNPISTSEGRCMMASVIDITERLRAQEAMKSLPKRLLDAQETERRRIARELHDELGQTLSASQIKLRALEKKLKGSPEANKAAEVLGILGTMLQQVRQLSLDLRPAVLDDLGLAAAIRWFVRERVIQNDLEVKVDVPLTLPRFPVRVETAIFRSFQSTVTNIVRHAEARTVQVSLHFDAPRLTLEIRDDGKGFDVDAAQKMARQGKSLGLLGMMEWVRLCGGDMVIESAVGRGTVVRAVISIDEENDKPEDGSRGG